jgi:ribonuclease HI
VAKAAAWRAIGGEGLVRQGITAEWKDAEAPHRLLRKRKAPTYNPSTALATQYSSLLAEELEQGVVAEIDPTAVRWANPTFLVPKKNGKFRKILDCRALNEELRDVPFKMEGPSTVRELARPGDWATSLDIHSAFNHIPVHPSLQPYLTFSFRGKTYGYKAMPFGVKHAPRVFTLVMRRAIRAVRERWHVRAISYMDDLLFLFDSEATARTLTREIATFLTELGWTLAPEKCEMEPTQEINFLGWRWNLRTLAVTMTTARATAMRATLTTWRRRAESRQRCRTRDLAALIGNLNFLRFQTPEASLYLARLDLTKQQAVAHFGWSGYCTLNPSLLGEIKWWTRTVIQNRPHQLETWPVSSTLTTDASPWGWGATLEFGRSKLYRYGFWSSTQRTWSSNKKELMAVYESLRGYRRKLKAAIHTSVLVRSDNTTTVADIMRMRASKSLLPPLRNLFLLTKAMRIQLTAIHLPGVQNGEADKLSRMGTAREYFLREQTLQWILRELEFQPDTDPFAASPYLPSTTTIAHPGEGLRIPWAAQKLFLHPPPHLIGKCLSKIRWEPAQAILIAPAWPSQPWSPLLSRLSQRQVHLGPFSAVMEVTARFRREGWLLPPGNVVAALLDTRMTKASVF